MKAVKIHFESYLLLILVCIIPFIQSASDVDKAERYSINILPSFIPVISSYLRWGILACMFLIFTYNIKTLFLKINQNHLLISAFYLIQFIYAIATQTDVFRYIGLVTISVFLPVVVTLAMLKNHDLIVKYMKYIIYVLISASLLMNLNMVFSGLRFQGFASNPNLYGLTAVFWLTILLLPGGGGKKNETLNTSFIAITLMTVVLSGSRNALVAAFIILAIHYRTRIVSIIVPSIIFFVVTYYILTLLDLQSIIDRMFNIGNSFEDSGRITTWERAFVYIRKDLLWGHGMDANLTLATTGNLHNCYIRYVLSMGLVFTIISFIFYLLYLAKIVIHRTSKIPPVLIGFIIAFTLANIGEDFFVGIGSSVIIYFCIIIGLITYYSSDKLLQTLKK